ncbi:hypothetical protein QYM36_011115 [Artemia franciscana]|uniref:Uncharacterized protein n=1 Tax=Artemia franciscana TaxID=6661 RepID=A0AA88L0V4_ARTSF|nr:hypothetical protein QYM36_011115 [Artemia franciscana]
MFGFFKKTKDDKVRIKRDDTTDDEKQSNSKRDSLTKNKKLTVNISKSPEDVEKKKTLESPKMKHKSEGFKSKPPKSPESPGQRFKNKVLGSPLLRGRRDAKNREFSFDDLSESSATDNSKSEESKQIKGLVSDQKDSNNRKNSDEIDIESKNTGCDLTHQPSGSNSEDSQLSPFGIVLIEPDLEISASQRFTNDSEASNKFQYEKPGDDTKEGEDARKSEDDSLTLKQGSARSLIDRDGTTKSQTTSSTEFLSINTVKMPLKKCTTPEISASVENLKKEYLMEMINKESTIIDLQMKLNQTEVLLKDANQKVSAFEEEKLASMSQHHALGEALEAARQEASSLAEELVKKSSKLNLFEASSHDNARLLAELTARNRSLEQQLQEKTQKVLELDKVVEEGSQMKKRLEDLEKLEADLKERDAYDAERDEEIRMLQEALEEAFEEKLELEAKINMNASRETQLLEDFEWKLHEIERDYKSKVSDAEAKGEERVRQELLEERKTILDERKRVEDQLKEVLHLKSFEAEVVQLRGLVIEQQRAIRVAARQIEQLKNDERILQDHVKKLKKNDEHHSKRVMLDEESLKKRVEEAKQEICGEWEDKFKRECSRLRLELEAIHQEENSLALESLRLEKDQELQDIKTSLESRQRELLSRIVELQDALALKDHNFSRQTELLKSQAERDISDGKKQIEKLIQSHSEEIQRLKNSNETEMNNLFQDCENRISANIESAVREKLEQKKQELEIFYDEKIESLTKHHQSQINALQNLIEEEKQDALTMLEEHYRGQLLMLQDHAHTLQKKITESDAQWQAEIRKLRHVILSKEDELKRLQSELQQSAEIIDSQSTESHILKTSLETVRYELQQLKQLDEILKQENYKLKNDNVVLKQEMVTLLDALNRERQERYEEQQRLETLKEKKDAEVDWRSEDGLSSESPPTGSVIQTPALVCFFLAAFFLYSQWK